MKAAIQAATKGLNRLARGVVVVLLGLLGVWSAATRAAPPTVALTSPSANLVFAFVGPGAIMLAATAADSDGSVSKVEFYQGTTLIGTATDAPYAVTWSNPPAGSYSLTAKATDNRGATTTSAAVPITVIANSAPTVSLTSPTPNQSLTAPATLQLAATASDPDNNLAKVEFFQNGSLIATLLAPPYTASWNNVGQGSYLITAVATDAIGAQATSASATLTVTSAQASLYFIHADHLGTPRLVTDSANQVVWRHLPTTEPFGNTPPEEDPNATGNRFEMPLAFPGQYRDRESGLSYNYFRDYDPATGRYPQFDPIGLRGGINGYSYVGGNPLSYADPSGLDRYYLVNRELEAVGMLVGDSATSRMNPLTHTFVLRTTDDGGIVATYSWGNAPNLTGWTKNYPLDKLTGGDALRKGLAEKVGGPELDDYFEGAFNQVRQEYSHTNGIVTFNCKFEADHLIYKAKQASRLGASQ